MQIEVGPAAGDFRPSSHDRRNHPCTVPELTRNASIKLNARVSLRRRPFPLSISHRTISPRPGPPWQSRQAIILRLAALLFASWSNGVVWRKRRTIGVRVSSYRAARIWRAKLIERRATCGTASCYGPPGKQEDGLQPRWTKLV